MVAIVHEVFKEVRNVNVNARRTRHDDGRSPIEKGRLSLHISLQGFIEYMNRSITLTSVNVLFNLLRKCSYDISF